MDFAPTDWHNLLAGGTPLNAGALAGSEVHVAEYAAAHVADVPIDAPGPDQDGMGFRYDDATGAWVWEYVVSGGDLPTIQRTDAVAISATTFRAIYVALGAGQVRDAGLYSTSGHVGDSGANAWNARLCVSRVIDGNPTTVAGGLQTIAQRDLTNNNFSANAIDANKPWGFGGEVWTDAATYLQPNDVLGILWEKTGAPSNIPTPLIYATRVEPAPV